MIYVVTILSSVVFNLVMLCFLYKVVIFGVHRRWFVRDYRCTGTKITTLTLHS